MLPLAPAIAYPFFALMGLALGSFGNVVAYRLPQGESLGGRSQCPHCARVLGARELIPVISWLVQRARCLGCRKPISMQYPLVELGVASLFVLAGVYHSFALFPSLALGIVLWSMLLIALIDYRYTIIPDALTVVLALSALALQWVTTGTLHISGALVGAGFMGAQWILSRGRWVGSGDIPLAGALGLLVGTWQMMIIALMASYIGGAVVAAVLLATGAIRRGAHLPFGPFLIAGAVSAYFVGQYMMAVLFRY